MVRVRQNRLSFSADGQVLVIAHGREVLVYPGVNKSPLWWQECAADVVAVGTRSSFVFAVDQQGGFHRWDALSGGFHDTLSIPNEPLGMAVSSDGNCAVFTERRLYLLRDLEVVQSIDQPSINALAWSSGFDKKIAAGDRTGHLWIFEWSGQKHLSEQPSGSLNLGGQVESIVWDNRQSWFVSAGGKIWEVDAAGKSFKVALEKTQKPTQLVAISADGQLLAATVGNQEVIAFHYRIPQLAGFVEYQDRTITGLEFGPENKLGVSLDTGDGNIIDFGKSAGNVSRTETHPGRPLNRWLLSCNVMPIRQGVEKSSDRNTKDHLDRDATTRQETNHQKPKNYPAWAGPVLGMVAGLVFGARMVKEFPGNEALAFAVAIGIGGLAGSIVMLLDLSRKR